MQSERLQGYAAALFMVTVWGGWIVLSRRGVTAGLTPYDVAFFRFAVPSLFLWPVLWRGRAAVLRAGWANLFFLCCGAGAPFILIGVTGMKFAPAAHIGALMPGTLPLFVALITVLFMGERMSRVRVAGFALIVLGDLAIGGYSALRGADEAWRGHLLFLTAALMWSGYTLAMRRSGLGPWLGAAVVSIVSFVGFTPVYFLWLEPRIFAAAPAEIATQIAIQGFGSGLFALAAYGLAIRRLGASQAAAFVSLTPAFAALIAIPVLGEIPDLASSAGVVLVGLGVALASGAFDRTARPVAPVQES